LFVVPGHSGRDFDLRLHAQPGCELLQWPGLRVEDYLVASIFDVAADRGHLSRLWADAAGFRANGQDLQRHPGQCQFVHYGTTNNQLVDISPTGNMCAGTWNRNTAAALPTTPSAAAPNPLPSSGNLPYGIAYITASAQGVSSNPVQVFVHAQVTSVTLVGPQSCVSQAAPPVQLDAQACFAGSNNKQQLLCAPPSVTNFACPLPPGVTSVPDCSAAIGTLSYSVATSSIASINSETNQITAELPGTTIITASIAGSGSSAGYFTTCPPASINVTLANSSTSGTVTQGVTQDLTTTVYDTNVDVPPYKRESDWWMPHHRPFAGLSVH
jgi:hypothetical protein